jgi:predicted transcriptional regulator
MEDGKLGLVEGKFADIVWENAPLSTRALVELCEKQLNWKRTTTYTVLKKLCERGLFQTENSTVTVLVGKADFLAMQGEKLIEESYGGSLPAFLAAFTSRKKLTGEEIAEIRRMIDACEEGGL